MAEKTIKILYVDDEKANLERVRSGLSSFARRHRLNFQIDTCISAEDALQKGADLAQYDLIVTDWNMPRMRGDEFAATLRGIKYASIPANKPLIRDDVPIIFFTSVDRFFMTRLFEALKEAEKSGEKQIICLKSAKLSTVEALCQQIVAALGLDIKQHGAGRERR